MLVQLVNERHPGGRYLHAVLQKITTQHIWMPWHNSAIKLRGGFVSKQHCSNEIDELVAALMKHIHERCPEVEVLSTFSIFDPKSYAGMNQPQLRQFGTDELECIVKHVSKAEQPEAEPWIRVDKAVAMETLKQFTLVKSILS